MGFSEGAVVALIRVTKPGTIPGNSSRFEGSATHQGFEGSPTHQGVEGDTEGGAGYTMGGWAQRAAGERLSWSMHTGRARVPPRAEEVTLNGRTQGRRARWLRGGLVVAALIAVHALGGGSAQAATAGIGSVGAQRIAAARDAAATPGIVLAGFTSQNLPSFFKVARNGRTLTVGAIALDMTCTSGAQPVLPDSLGRVPIKPSGKLHDTVVVPPTAVSNGETVSATDSLTAHLNQAHTQLAGIWRLRVTYSLSNGMSDKCDSGPVRFNAAAR